MNEYKHKINKNNPYRTRCFECGHAIRKKSLARKCPHCGFRGSLMILHKYDLVNCPLCSHLIGNRTGHTAMDGICPLCDSDIAIVRQSIKRGGHLNGYLCIKTYKELGGL